MRTVTRMNRSLQYTLQVGERLPPVRALLDELQVGPMPTQVDVLTAYWIIPTGWSPNPFGVLSRIGYALRDRGIRPRSINLTTQSLYTRETPTLILDFAWKEQGE